MPTLSSYKFSTTLTSNGRIRGVSPRISRLLQIREVADRDRSYTETKHSTHKQTNKIYIKKKKKKKTKEQETHLQVEKERKLIPVAFKGGPFKK